MRKPLLATLSLFAFSLIGCSHNDVQGTRKLASEDLLSPQQPELIKGEKWSSKDARNSQAILEIFRRDHRERTGDAKVMRRDAHPKHHGCVQSSMTIDNSHLPEKYKVGILENNAQYKGIIRFSNGNPDHTKKDGDADVRGFALKLNVDYSNYMQDIGAEGGKGVHDFVFMNANAFFLSDTEEYRELMEDGIPKFMLKNPLSAFAIIKSLIKPGSPLDTDYHSATPYRLGDTTMKMMFKSCTEKKSRKPWGADKDFLGKKLASTLKKKSACFDFYVQPNKDPRKNKIEDAMKVWNKRKSPFIKVGRLNIPKQVGFRSAQEMEKCENLSFNPWRAHHLNRPVGAVNRVRLDVYINQAKMRHDYNGINN